MQIRLVITALISLSSSLPFQGVTRDLWACSQGGNAGAYYTCPAPDFQRTATTECGYFKPGGWRRPCRNWGPNAADRPRSIGPDVGGSCLFYKTLDCSGEPVVPIERPASSRGRRLYCPGIMNTQGAEWFGSMICTVPLQNWHHPDE
ncbi:hypothetical protein IAQ61_008284 [Plenodomus lingam]|uniref:Predicted protein n=1 Tax=Leptosphaeria maculans (strain JN3 / isolate v23.1.3 / race Av1-4-5-6-7-8) TaxID=985895 RepID=E4ZZH1_LEPMJ|nr:predicted protein [Plenodomus lingam JN3]KAH9867690.1 hypothetical protein IAQ61_008284 [Plenodomus lingam]CBX96766.1 predicted protein [Plenodomus lingam JN3]